MSVIPFVRKPQKAKPGPHVQDYGAIDIWDPLESLFGVVIPMSAAGQVDWKETPDAHVFMADVPGMKKDEVRIEVEEEKVLKISGQRYRENEEKNIKWHRAERYADSFHRSIKLPPDASLEGAKAVLENGVITVTVPKMSEKRAQGLMIPIA